MIALLRFFLILFMACYSALFTAALVYGLGNLARGALVDFDSAVFIQTLQVTAACMAVFMALGGSLLAEPFIRLFFPVRRMSLQEEKIVTPSLHRVRELYRQKYGRDIKARVLIIDAPHIDGLALGRGTIAVTKGLLATASQDEITSIIAHEAGHLHHRDGFLNFAQFLAWLPVSFPGGILRGSRPEESGVVSEPRNYALTGFIWIAGAILLPQFFLLWFLSFPVQWLSNILEKITAWPVEYRADRFAYDLGLGSGLVSLFSRMEMQDIRNEYGFLYNYAYSHPPTALRIDRIERRFMESRQVV